MRYSTKVRVAASVVAATTVASMLVTAPAAFASLDIPTGAGPQTVVHNPSQSGSEHSAAHWQDAQDKIVARLEALSEKLTVLEGKAVDHDAAPEVIEALSNAVDTVDALATKVSEVNNPKDLAALRSELEALRDRLAEVATNRWASLMDRLQAMLDRGFSAAAHMSDGADRLSAAADRAEAAGVDVTQVRELIDSASVSITDATDIMNDVEAKVSELRSLPPTEMASAARQLLPLLGDARSSLQGAASQLRQAAGILRSQLGDRRPPTDARPSTDRPHGAAGTTGV